MTDPTLTARTIVEAWAQDIGPAKQQHLEAAIRDALKEAAGEVAVIDAACRLTLACRVTLIAESLPDWLREPALDLQRALSESGAWDRFSARIRDEMEAAARKEGT